MTTPLKRIAVNFGGGYKMQDFTSPSPETLKPFRAIIDKAFDRSGKTAEGTRL